MIKNLAKKIKNIFSKKSEKLQKTKEDKSSGKAQNSSNYKKKGGNYHQRKGRKKETPEEYKARHAKMVEEKESKKEEVQKDENPNKPKPKKRSPKPKLEDQPTEPIAIVEKEPWDSSVYKVPVEDGKTRFHDLDMSEDILHAIYDLEFQYCTDVQAETLPRALMDEDVTAQAQTGTGKTAAFLVTIFNFIIKNPIKQKRKKGTPRALILAPTRELVLQIEKDARDIGKYVDCNILAILGGMDYNKQMNILKNKEVDIVICTPGRLIDFMNKRLIDLKKIEILIIDEADRMLDMGFIPDVKRIVVSTPQKSKRQTMFFTATMSGDVKNLAESWTKQAHDVTIESEDLAQKNVEQITYITTVEEKPVLLYNTIIQKELERVLIFANRRDDAKKLSNTLDAHGISCALLTGDVEQNQRIRRLERFREGKVRVLVATDVASRGIHVEGISHVINYNMPGDVEEYVHRIGRTGRAGASGTSINFADEQESYELPKLEEYLGKKIECTFPDEELLTPIPEVVKKKAAKKAVENAEKTAANKSQQKKRPYKSKDSKPPYKKRNNNSSKSENKSS